MQRLIDAEALKERIITPRANGKDLITELIDSMPTIDAEPVKHGEWVFNPSDAFQAMFAKPKCSECGFESADGWKYCPNCGCRMDKE